MESIEYLLRTRFNFQEIIYLLTYINNDFPFGIEKT